MAEVSRKLLTEVEAGKETAEQRNRHIEFIRSSSQILDLTFDTAIIAGENAVEMKKKVTGWGLGAMNTSARSRKHSSSKTSPRPPSTLKHRLLSVTRSNLDERSLSLTDAQLRGLDNQSATAYNPQQRSPRRDALWKHDRALTSLAVVGGLAILFFGLSSKLMTWKEW